MRMRDLLIRGMVAGVVASLLASAFAFVAGEPAIERAIAFETRAEASAHAREHAVDVHAAAAHPTEAGPEAAEPVSRGVQRTAGLVTGMLALGVAFGGVFSVVFASARGRLGAIGDRGTALLVALLTFAALYLLPFLKYPANPPAAGLSDTISARTTAYVGMLLVSALLTVGALVLYRALAASRPAWDAALLAALAFLVALALAASAMPAVDEVPEGFPADVLWQFRIASIGTQLVLWSGIGLVFGALTDRAARRA